MKKIIFTIAVTLLTAVGGSQAGAEMLMLTATNGGSFNFDAAGANDNLITPNADGTPEDGLSDVAFFLGYQTGPALNPVTEVVALNSGVGTSNFNTGQFEFDTVTFSNGVSVDAVANFRLVDATVPGLGHHVVYDVSFETTGVNVNTEGSLQSFVGFDFNGDGTDIIRDNEVISGFNDSEIAIGSVFPADSEFVGERTLLGDFTFPIGQGSPLTTVAASRSNVDAFNGAVGSNLTARFNGTSEGFSTGDLAFGAFNDFESRDIDQIDTTGGVIAFRSSASIPEPSTLMMASIGLGMVVFGRRKRA